MISKPFVCLLLALAAAFPAVALSQLDPGLTPRKIRATIEQLKPLHKEIGEPLAGDWLTSHQEAGQTFKQYGRTRPNVLTRRRHKLLSLIHI